MAQDEVLMMAGLEDVGIICLSTEFQVVSRAKFKVHSSDCLMSVLQAFMIQSAQW